MVKAIRKLDFRHFVTRRDGDTEMRLDKLHLLDGRVEEIEPESTKGLWLLQATNCRQMAVLARVDAQHLWLLSARLAPPAEPLRLKALRGRRDRRSTSTVRFHGLVLWLDDSQMAVTSRNAATFQPCQ